MEADPAGGPGHVGIADLEERRHRRRERGVRGRREEHLVRVPFVIASRRAATFVVSLIAAYPRRRSEPTFPGRHRSRS